jgi:hypothetical protein
MLYEVISFISDCAIENQPNWRVKFIALNDAIDAARIQHNKINNDEVYTVVLDSERTDEDDVRWTIYQKKEYTELKAQEIADELAMVKGKS